MPLHRRVIALFIIVAPCLLAQVGRREYAKTHPPRSSVGLIPLTDLGAGTYQGEEGGLYPGGKNIPPVEHLNAGLKLAREIAPIDGKIVLLSIGFSNPAIEFPAFQRLAAADPTVNPRLVTVNGCVGNQSSSVIADPQSNYWNIVGQRLAAAGAAAGQVQVLWIKEVVPGSSQPFPVDARKLYKDLVGTLQTARARFPNLKIAYLSSRTYGGYTEVGGSPEPWAYESGFSVKWVVSAQIAGRPELSGAPWVAWGPYLWTDGAKGRKDGFVYLREDLREDGLHPSERGQAKIAALLLAFFKSEPTARPWFLKP